MSDVSFLIVDESPAVQTFARRLLETYGFDPLHIHTTSLAEAGAEIGAEVKPDYLFSQWNPQDEVNGITLAKYLKVLNPECAFALSSKNISAEYQQEAKALGADFVLGRPFTADALRSELHQAFEVHAKHNPKMAAHVAARLPATTPISSAGPTTKDLPKLISYRQGDRVRYQNRIATVKYVILRRGELVVQLQEAPGLIEASRLVKI